MTALKRSLPLILIGLGLLLSVAKGGAENPSPRAALQSHRKATPDQNTENTKPYSEQPYGLATSAPSGPAQIGGANCAADKPTEEQRHNRREEALEHQLVCLTAALAIVEVITLFVYFFTMLANIRAANAAKASADAAKASADAANASLHVYRPFLSVQILEPNPQIAYSIDWIPSSFRINILNDGIGPADILRYHMEAQVFPWDGNEPIPEYERINSLTLVQSVVPPGSERVIPRTDVPRRFDVTPRDFAEMRAGTMRLGLHGIVIYRGGPAQEYWTRFFWWYLVDSAGARHPDIVRANRPEVNAHT